MIFFLVSCSCYAFWGEYFTYVGEKISESEDALKVVPALCLIMSGVVFTYSGRLLRPKEDGNKNYYNWELYDYVKINLYISKFYVVLFLLISSGVFLFNSEMSDSLVCFLTLISAGISSICAYSVYFAYFSLKEILELNEN